MCCIKSGESKEMKYRLPSPKVFIHEFESECSKDRLRSGNVMAKEHKSKQARIVTVTDQVNGIR